MTILKAKNFWIVPVALAAGAMTTGCLFGGSKTAPNGAGQPQSGPAWKVTLQASCERYADEYCIGNFGFTVSADQRYEVGPGPEHQLASGFLTDDEFARISVAVGEAGVSALNTESCEEHITNPEGIAERVSITRGGEEAQVINAELSRFCYRTGSADTAKRLHDAIHDLAEKYYPQPFPDRCAEAANSVAALYSAVQNCHQDSDCVYADTSYNAVAPNGTQFVVTDSCSTVRPIVVANAVALAAGKDKLLAALAQAQDACGTRIVREDCEGVRGFESAGAAPVCQQNVCRANPNVGSATH